MEFSYETVGWQMGIERIKIPNWVLLAVCNLIPYHLNLPVATRVVGRLKWLFLRVCLKMSVCKVAAWHLAGKTDRSHNLSHIPCALTSQHLAFKERSGMAELICYYNSNQVELYKQLGKKLMYCFTWPMEFVTHHQWTGALGRRNIGQVAYVIKAFFLKFYSEN